MTSAPYGINNRRLRSAARVLRQGGIIAYPTEAVYGLGCDPFNQAAVLRILALKRRSARKGLILIASTFEHTLPFVNWEAVDRASILASWPAAVTWVLPALPDAPRWLSGDPRTIAMRLTAHPLCRMLCTLSGHAIVSTSANRAKRQPARSPLAIRHAFGAGVDAIVRGALGGNPHPSVIRDAHSGECLRP